MDFIVGWWWCIRIDRISTIKAYIISLSTHRWQATYILSESGTPLFFSVINHESIHRIAWLQPVLTPDFGLRKVLIRFPSRCAGRIVIFVHRSILMTKSSADKSRNKDKFGDTLLGRKAQRWSENRTVENRWNRIECDSDWKQSSGHCHCCL